MRRTLLPVTLLFIGGAVGTTQPAKEKPADKGATRIAVVDIGRIFNSFGGSHKFKCEMDPSLGELQQKRRRLTDEIKAYEEALLAKDLPVAKGEEYRKGIQERKMRL